MSDFSQTETENRAIALAAFNLTKALMDALEGSGALATSEIQAVLDQTLISLEHRAQDKATDLARRMIEATVVTRTSRGPAAPDSSAAE